MFNAKDLANFKNLQRFLGKVKVELDISEIMASAEMVRWLANLGQRIELNIKESEEAAKKALEPKAEPIKITEVLAEEAPKLKKQSKPKNLGKKGVL